MRTIFMTNSYKFILHDDMTRGCACPWGPQRPQGGQGPKGPQGPTGPTGTRKP